MTRPRRSAADVLAPRFRARAVPPARAPSFRVGVAHLRSGASGVEDRAAPGGGSRLVCSPPPPLQDAAL